MENVDKLALMLEIVAMENVRIPLAIQSIVEDADKPARMQMIFAAMEIAHLKIMSAVTEPSVLLVRSVAMAIASARPTNGNVLGSAFP